MSKQVKEPSFDFESASNLLSLMAHLASKAIQLNELEAVVDILAMRYCNNRAMTELLAGVELFPQTLINVRMHAGTDWKNLPGLQAAIACAERALGQNGRVLIRPSGTEPVLRVMVEASDPQQSRQWAEQIAEQVPRSSEH